MSATLTPQAVEAMIEEAGRQQVFDRARALGWTAAMSPPLWVWAQIAMELRAHPNSKEDRG